MQETLTLIKYFQRLYGFHEWANGRILEAAAQLSSEQFHQVQPEFGWGSAQGILVHMLSAEWIWLSRWQGASPKEFLKVEDFPTVEALRRRWAAQSAELRAFLDRQTPESLSREVAYTTTRGENYHQPLAGLLAHVVNHASEHRAELAALLTRFNIPHRETEMNQYFLEQSGQR